MSTHISNISGAEVLQIALLSFDEILLGIYGTMKATKSHGRHSLVVAFDENSRS